MAESPTYYTRGNIEVWDFIRDQKLNYHLGCALKYICRAGKKPDNTAAKDLNKAIHYLQNELQFHVSQASERVSDSVWLDKQYGQSTDASVFDR
tara:strand:+ start:936 stop:1217 length:282 start_codon:yes stop_codon:yes gene_type:complete